MSSFLTYSEVDTGLQRRLGGANASESVRLAAINDAVNDLYAEFDIESGIRSMVGYFVPNGRAIDITNFVSDFKHPKDLRYLSASKHDSEFSNVDDDLFVQHIGNGQSINEYSISFKDGKLYLRVNTEDGPKSTILHSMNDVDDNGTWSASEDASNLTETDVKVLEQSASLIFDIDVSQSANNYAVISVSDMDAKDLSDYNGLGRIQFWIYLPSVDNFTSIEVMWGSDSSNYWSASATSQADGTSLRAGWNYIEVDWANATQTGTVDNENIDYLAVKLNYTSSYTDQTGVVVEQLKMYLPLPMELFYYTYYLSQDSSGNFQEELTTTSGDQLLLPRRYKSLVEIGALIYLIPIVFGSDGDTRRIIEQRKYNKIAKELGLDIGNRVKVPSRKIKLKKQW